MRADYQDFQVLQSERMREAQQERMAAIAMGRTEGSSASTHEPIARRVRRSISHFVRVIGAAAHKPNRAPVVSEA